MNNKSKEYENELFWPLSHTLYNAMNGFRDKLLQGYVQQLSQILKNPVIAVVKIKECDKKSKALKDCKHNELVIINEEAKENREGSFCQWMRQQSLCICNESCDCETVKKKICDKSDKDAVLNLGKGNLDGFKLSEKSGVTYYRYKCTMGFMEWLIPIYVKDEIQGAFITGQFMPPEFLNNYEKLVDILKKKLNIKYTVEKLKEVLESNNPESLWKEEPNASELCDTHINTFFKKVDDFNKQINELYKKAEEQHMALIREKILDVVWGRNSLYEIDQGLEQDYTSWDILVNRFTAIRTYLFDAMIILRDIFNLKDIVVYKPRSDPNNKKNIPDVIQGADLTKENRKVEGDSLPINREYTPSEHNIYFKGINETPRENNELGYWIFDKPDAIKPLLRPNPYAKGGGGIPKDLTGAHLVICHMKDYSDQSVAFYFKTDSKEDVSSLNEIFRSVSVIFLAQWNGVYSEYNRSFYEAANMFLDHELGQVLAGMRIAIKKIQNAIEPALAPEHKSVAEAYPKLPKEVRSFINITERQHKNLYDYIELAGSIVKSSFLKMVNKDFDKTWFYPYGKFLLRLRNIYLEDFENEHKVLHMTNNGELQRNQHPELYADAAMLEQSVNNLLRNALKYSHWYTNIEMTARRSVDDPDYYEFIITNYGMPIPKDQEDRIFQLGIRSDNAKETEQTGKGFGLHIAQAYAQIHGGNVELVENDKICDYNVPLLKIYAESSHPQVDKHIQAECKKYLEELQKTDKNGKNEFDRIVSEDLDYIVSGTPQVFTHKPLTPLFYLRRIDMPTARITFKLKIRMKEGERYVYPFCRR